MIKATDAPFKKTAACCFFGLAISAARLLVATSSDKALAAIVTPAECARADLRLYVLIEDEGNNPAAVHEQLSAAYLTLLEARHICATGRPADALAMYESITFAPVSTADSRTAPSK